MITGAQCYTPRKFGSYVLQGVSIDVSADTSSVNISVAILVKCQSRLGRVKWLLLVEYRLTIGQQIDRHVVMIALVACWQCISELLVEYW